MKRNLVGLEDFCFVCGTPVNGEAQIKLINYLSDEICNRFGVPGARELDFDKLFEITASVMKYGGAGHLVAVKVMEAYNTGKLFKK